MGKVLTRANSEARAMHYRRVFALLERRRGLCCFLPVKDSPTVVLKQYKFCSPYLKRRELCVYYLLFCFYGRILYVFSPLLHFYLVRSFSSETCNDDRPLLLHSSQYYFRSVSRFGKQKASFLTAAAVALAESHQWKRKRERKRIVSKSGIAARPSLFFVSPFKLRKFSVAAFFLA